MIGKGGDIYGGVAFKRKAPFASDTLLLLMISDPASDPNSATLTQVSKKLSFQQRPRGELPLDSFLYLLNISQLLSLKASLKE